MLTAKQASKLIKLAYNAINSVFLNTSLDYSKEKKEFNKKRGVFVTLTKDNQLRGCIGFPYSVYSLAKAVVDAAKAAAFSDARFSPLKEEELDKIKIEISVLTKPKEIKFKENEKNAVFKKFKIGRDGLIVKLHGFVGLLLPQVAIKMKWNALEFLEATCIKAGLPKNSWMNKDCKIYKFQAQIFSDNKK